MSTTAGARGRIPLARPAIGDAEVSAAERALRSGRLVIGPENQQFERSLATLTGRRHAIAVSSGTAALELTLWGLGIGPGDEVLIPAFGFVAAANAVARQGAVPVPIDVDPATWNVDVGALTAAVGEATRAIISIDQLGLVAEAAPLVGLADDAGLVLIEDAACALGGCDCQGVVGGGYGRAATLSFHPRKVITTGEGGAITCDDDDLAARLRALRNHGQVGPGEFVCVGTNARLGEPAAAVGNTQLARMEAMVAERRLIASGYQERLAGLRAADRLSWQVVPAEAVHTYQTFAVLLHEDCDRDRVCRLCDANDIEVGPATYAFHRIKSHARGGQAAAGLAVADALHDRGLALPLYVGMRSTELDRVCEVLAEGIV